MGLVASAIEAAGISTVSLSNIPDLTEAAGAPRIAAIEYPFARTLGRPGDARGQTEVLRAALKAGAEIEGPGSVRHLPFTWPESKAKAQAHPSEPPPIATYLKRHPWHLPRFMAREIP